jgi:membrane protein CcdC involved in cytochrome C biogenesis
MQSPTTISIAASLVGLTGVMIWRVREGRTAVSMKKIVMPPLGMATGFCMFFVPAFRIPWSWAGFSFFVGAVALAYPVLKTSRLVRQGDLVMMQRSTAFFAVILLLAALRLVARSYFDSFLTVQQTAALFFILAFGIIVRWRVQMLLEYRKLTSSLS